MQQETDRKTDQTEVKKELRKRMRALQKALPEAYVRSAGEEIQQRILSSPRYRESGSIFLYLSTPKEVPTDLILRQALAEGKKIYVPKCIGKEMLAVRIRSLDHLEPGMLGILEPRDWSETADADQLDLILVPCLAAAPDGRRLGHGGGYYDRFLSERRENALCLCFRRMLCGEIPMDGHDVPMPCVVTET